MAIRASKKQKKLLLQKERENKDQNEDRISNLSDDVSHHILSFLPIQFIAQTSVLSKRWLYLWSSFPSLDFSNPDDGRRIGSCSLATPELHYLKIKKPEAIEYFITLILSRRHKQSNIQTFRFTGDLTPSCFHNCVRSLVNHKIEELDLDLTLNYPFNTPRCLLNCDSLRNLSLKARKQRDWDWDYPKFRFLTASAIAASTLLRSLRSLSLINIDFTDSPSIIADLFSASYFPLLKKLNLSECEGLGNAYLRIKCPKLEDLSISNMKFNGLEISGMKLERLEVKGCFQNCRKQSWVEILAPELRTFHWEHNGITDKCSMMNFPLLVHAVVRSFHLSDSKSAAARVQSTANLVSALSHTGTLAVDFLIIELLSGLLGTQPLPYSFHNLKTLQIHTGLNKCYIPGVACLLKSSPNLQNLSILILDRVLPSNTFWSLNFWNNIGGFSCTEEEYWESQILSSQVLRPFLHHLERIKIRVSRIQVYRRGINLAKFLLKHGCVLQEMVLSSEEETNGAFWQETISWIKKLPHASPDVHITFC